MCNTSETTGSLHRPSLCSYIAATDSLLLFTLNNKEPGFMDLFDAIKTSHMLQRQRSNANPCSLVSSYFLLIIVVIVSELMCTDAVNFRVKSTLTPSPQTRILAKRQYSAVALDKATYSILTVPCIYRENSFSWIMIYSKQNFSGTENRCAK